MRTLFPDQVTCTAQYRRDDENPAIPDDCRGSAEIVLEPSSYRPALTSQKALYDAVFPAAILSTNDIAADYQRLKALGVKFRGKPKKVGSRSFVFFDDTCGNFIVLLQSEAADSTHR